MGWFKSILKAIDPLRPEWEKSLSSKVDKSLGNTGEFASVLPKETPVVTPEVTTSDTETPAISQDEAENLSSKRLARLGRYFTSPLGVLSGASTGSQKIFS